LGPVPVLQILLTERHRFGPPYGSAAVELTPSDPLLSSLQNPKPLVRHLAFLDLCFIAEKSVDRWRRAALYRDESGESYRRVIGTCLEPLEGVIERVKVAVGSGSGPGLSGFKQGFQLQRGVAAGGKRGDRGDPEEIFRDFQVRSCACSLCSPDCGIFIAWW
jgi:hypothetical protein